MLKKNMLYIGIIFLLIGLATVFLNPDQQQANLEIARHATNAQAAAQAISAALSCVNKTRTKRPATETAGTALRTILRS